MLQIISFMSIRIALSGYHYLEQVAQTVMTGHNRYGVMSNKINAKTDAGEPAVYQSGSKAIWIAIKPRSMACWGSSRPLRSPSSSRSLVTITHRPQEVP